MAGIGFQLQRLLREDSYKSAVEAYIYAAVISSGSWLMAVISLILISITSHFFVAADDVSLFQGLIAYVFAGSLIFTGIIQMPTTRYIADRLFVSDSKSLLPCYHGVTALVVVLGGLITMPFFLLSGLSAASAVGAVLLFQSVSVIWMGMLFLSAAKDYTSIVKAFMLGYGMSISLSLIGADFFQLEGLVWGMSLGQVLLAVLLSVRIRVEFPSDRNMDLHVAKYWQKMPYLIVIGLTYNLGIWIDKIIFWLSPRGVQLDGLFYAAPTYDSCIYIAYLSIVPAMTIFLIRIETSFYRHYASFYEAVTQGKDLKTIRRRKTEMQASLRLSVARLIKTQGIFSFLLLLGAPIIMEWLHLSDYLLPTFRLCLMAAFLQVMLLLLMILLLYFDWQKEVAAISTLFLLLNGLFTWYSLHLPIQVQAIGYLAACFVCMGVGMLVLEYKMELLEQETFMGQPYTQ